MANDIEEKVLKGLEVSFQKNRSKFVSLPCITHDVAGALLPVTFDAAGLKEEIIRVIKSKPSLYKLHEEVNALTWVEKLF